MAEEKKDHWSSEAYQHSAGFVPKLATKIVSWLEPQKDDVILDLGCGDGVVNIEMNQVFAQGSGSIHGTDASPAMIEAAKQAAEKAGASKCTFEVVDATKLDQASHLLKGQYTKIFSNAALHWILGACKADAARQAAVFRASRDALAPGGVLVFEMGGMGNVAEMRAALLAGAARRAGLAAAAAHDPWFFPDEAWAAAMLEHTVGGWKVERSELEYRPTVAAAGGVDGWVRLFGAPFFEAVPEGTEREETVREVVEVLETVCRNPSGGYQLGYVRLRVKARKL